MLSGAYPKEILRPKESQMHVVASGAHRLADGQQPRVAYHLFYHDQISFKLSVVAATSSILYRNDFSFTISIPQFALSNYLARRPCVVFFFDSYHTNPTHQQ
ncbi:hypothetical protein PC116_g8 [Phytophthora cactorum]|uniref:Uncharacterized protein n=1 Tax=Phytophthora cactorum TaxID=29920 RepID=A0A8T1DXX0_9STRA|nr:hypothetical protein Pcac1_g10963 [Phytophthora cactorum]KAG2944669.1 hypothetical protein PC115_g129 [Phytophthora cactorum]KAG2952194.1 hypothetical protein PC117_g2979 [Phytophthora cactorum]KAG3105994.1 hypothetical protein PC121_g286 [Phytophthora cactorum]KAG4252224.1 hypothetical protein PC116_g8 [Phytophthora cactorum]